MSLNREISRLLKAFLLFFGLIACAAAYWSVAGTDTILLRDDNPRLVTAEASIRRGSIFDRSDNLLVSSLVNSDGTVTRKYLHPEVSSIVGYSSLRYGVGGAEAAYDAILRGDTLARDFVSDLASKLLHRPQEGSNIKLTIDIGIQQTLTEALNEHRGAAVVLSVPDGAVLALVSLPSFDPSTLDADWDHLVAAPDKPFFNRVLQGNYQPGGLLETPLMAAALLAQEPLTELQENANQAVRVAEVELHCALMIPFTELSLRDAYAFACPGPFAQLAQRVGEPAVSDVLETFQFDQPVVLGDFVSTTVPASSALLSFSIDSSNLVETALGQGQIVVTPLQMAVMAAAVLNDGNAPRPYTLVATQSSDSSTWTAARSAHPTVPYTTQNTARELQDLMRQAVTNGAALNAARPGIDIGGHATLAFSGDESQAWFIGFATLAGGRGVAAAIVLENSVDPGLAADIGGTVLAAAQQTLRPG